MSGQNAIPDRKTPIGRGGPRWGIRAVERVTALGLASLLLRSGFIHVANPYYFLSTVYSYELLGIETGKWLALLLPFLQIVIAVCLLARWWLREAYGFTCLMFLVFLGVQVSTLVRAMRVSCYCFDATENVPIGRQTLFIAGLPACAASLGLLCSIAKKSGPQGS
jgi:hypothetical protein